MPSSSAILPRLRPGVTITAVGDDDFTVKDRQTRAYFRVGRVEQFLLNHLDGTSTRDTVRQGFAREFGESLDNSDLDDFLKLVRDRNLLENQSSQNGSPAVVDENDELNGQSWLFFRKSLFDPDTLLNRLEPWLRWVWSGPFVALSLMCILFAGWTLWTARADLMIGFRNSLCWQTVTIVWATLVLITVIHEFAHGLTCKHYGGDVREMGALMIFFMPCFYCDVTDAWLIPRKSHRLWVTLAGGYADLCVWSAAVFLWRVTLPDSLLHYISQVALSTLGTRVFLNLNPFLRLDGYYLISDWLEIPNLRTQSRDYFMSHVRWFCWGADRPKRQQRGGWLLLYGGTMWLMALVTLDLIVLSLHRFVWGQFGWVGTLLSGIGLIFVARRVFHGLLTSEFWTMLKRRHLRTATWAVILLVLPATLCALPIEYSSTGDVTVRSGCRSEVHAAVGGFLRDIRIDEGSEVSPGALLARIEVPDLESLIIRKEADIHECQATLTKLRAGPRREEVAEQEARIRRASDWVELAHSDLAKARLSLQHSLHQLDEAILQSSTELDFAQHSYNRAVNLYRLGAYAGEQLRSEQKRLVLLKSRVTQAEAERQAKEAEGVRSAEAELARREKELADARSALSLLKAGSRTEDIAAESAKLTRLEEELRFLNGEREKQTVVASAGGIVSTPRMLERDGVLLDKGAVVCVVEDLRQVCVEIEIEEDSIAGVAVGQDVEIRVRALPFDSFRAKVERIAPSASIDVNATRSRVVVKCSVNNSDKKLKPGMTGTARISRGTERLGSLVLQRICREFRTEFWW